MLQIEAQFQGKWSPRYHAEMIKSLVALVLVAGSFGGAAAEPTKREQLNQMLIAMGSELPASEPQLDALARNLSDADIKAVIAFFKTTPGRHLAIATRELNKAAIADLERAIARSKNKRTMADLQTLAVSVEAYAVDNEAYPPTSDLDQLSKSITPTYLRSMLRLDGWGKEYIYVSDTKNYRIISAGADGMISPDSQTLGIQHGDFGDDLIFENGEFIQPGSKSD